MNPQFTCILCNQSKPVDDGHPGSDGFYTVCRSCWNNHLCHQFMQLCPPAYLKTDPVRLPQKQLTEVLDWKVGPQGLLMIGDTGKTKTRCAWLLVKRLMTMQGISVMAFDATGLAHGLERRYRQEEDVHGWLDSICSAPVLFLDDFAKFKCTERIMMEVFGIVERRCAAELPIIATTNATGDEIVGMDKSDNWGTPLVRRLREFCNVVKF